MPTPNFDPAAARERCMAHRKRILEISQQVQALHAAGAFSCLEMVDTIYNGLTRGAAGNSPDTFMRAGSAVIRITVYLGSRRRPGPSVTAWAWPRVWPIRNAMCTRATA